MLKDKIVVIYGAGGDIGAGVARAFARERGERPAPGEKMRWGSNLVMSDDPVAADFNPNRAYLASLVAAGLVAGNVRVLRTLARLLCCCCAVLAALAQPRNLDLESVPRKAKTHVCLITPVVCRSVDGNFGNLPIFPSTGQNRFRYIHTRLVSPKSAATTFRGGGHMHVTLSVEYATLNSV